MNQSAKQTRIRQIRFHDELLAILQLYILSKDQRSFDANPNRGLSGVPSKATKAAFSAMVPKTENPIPVSGCIPPKQISLSSSTTVWLMKRPGILMREFSMP